MSTFKPLRARREIDQSISNRYNVSVAVGASPTRKDTMAEKPPAKPSRGSIGSAESPRRWDYLKVICLSSEGTSAQWDCLKPLAGVSHEFHPQRRGPGKPVARLWCDNQNSTYQCNSSCINHWSKDNDMEDISGRDSLKQIMQTECNIDVCRDCNLPSHYAANHFRKTSRRLWIRKISTTIPLISAWSQRTCIVSRWSLDPGSRQCAYTILIGSIS